MLDVEALYREHADDLYRVLRRRFDRSVPDAVIEDASGTTWAIARAKREQVREDNAMGWLVTVGRHEVLALLRKRRFEILTYDEVETADRRCSPELALEAREMLELFAELGANQRLALSLRAAEDVPLAVELHDGGHGVMVRRW
ncbi:MAG: sigma-70 family RNA polymerase sigma factor, partial [Actinobacteria bacterium]|nr:sigma-70 family RNA polymerase sigma factor [Actinomycetota bacterium]